MGPDEVPLVVGSHPILGGTYMFVAVCCIVLQCVLQSVEDGEMGPDEVPLVVGSHPILGGTSMFVAVFCSVLQCVAMGVAVCVAECKRWRDGTR